MKRTYRLLFGPLAAIILALGVAGLPLFIPGYSHVRQTVSEIGELGSPARIPFAIMLGSIAICLLLFASAVGKVLAGAHHSKLAAWLIGFMAIPVAGIGVFAFPHPLHNVFGLSELIAYQAPLAMALAWRGDSRGKPLVAVSWIAFLLIWLAIALNLSPTVPSIWVHLKPVHGLLQRALFATWFGWCALVGVLFVRLESLSSFTSRAAVA